MWKEDEEEERRGFGEVNFAQRRFLKSSAAEAGEKLKDPERFRKCQRPGKLKEKFLKHSLGKASKKKREKSGQADRLGRPPLPWSGQEKVKNFDFDFRL